MDVKVETNTVGEAASMPPRLVPVEVHTEAVVRLTVAVDEARYLAAMVAKAFVASKHPVLSTEEQNAKMSELLAETSKLWRPSAERLKGIVREHLGVDVDFTLMPMPPREG